MLAVRKILAHPNAYAKCAKVFWFFFSKKNCVLASSSRTFGRDPA
jgi:hypothetical protein